jgi:rubrerythrin
MRERGKRMEIKNEELLNIFANFEEEGRVFYKELANYVSEPVVKDYLLIISKEEAKHKEHFKEIMEGKGSRKNGWEYMPDLHKLADKNFKQGLFPKLNWNLEKFERGEVIKIAFGFAKKYEELSIEFYATLIKNCDDLETKILWIDLECEEKAHLCYIQQLIGNFPYEYQIH